MSASPTQFYLVCGDDEYQVETAARRFIERTVPADQRDFGLEIVDGRVDTRDDSLALFSACEEALLTDSLFGGGDKLVWLREPSFLSNERHARIGDIKERLAVFAKRVAAGFPEGKRLMITTQKINRGSVLFKAMKSRGEIVDFGNNLKPRESEDRARKFLDDYLKDISLDMKPAIRSQFISHVGTDSRMIANEIEKLVSYCGERTEVRSEDIEQIVSGGGATEIWPLLDAFGSRDHKETIKHLHIQLSQSENPIKLASMLEGRLSDLITLRELFDRKWAAGGGYQGVSWHDMPAEVDEWFSSQDKGMRNWHSFRLQSLAKQVAKWRLRDLRVARHFMLEMREQLVSSSLAQEWLLEVGLLRALQ